jgi:arabinose-5-phosphate isomerase
MKRNNLNAEQILSIARETIEIEKASLQSLLEHLGPSFVDVIHTIFESEGRLIVSGIGKSAIVGQKVVATMNSTGTPALFMHAADAIHGDLGMLLPNDIVMCISKSGETEEIKVLAPLIKSFNNILIGMTAKPDSFLAKRANYVLLTPVEKEADPNNLAPTASTTSQMALGDALATTLLALRGFTPKDFAQYHPGGSLGKQLYLRVHDLAQYNEKPLVKHDANLRTTILEISAKRLGATAVEKEGEIIGIVTDGDVRRMLENNVKVENIKASDIMTRDPKRIQAEEYAIHALNMLRQHNIHQLIVFEQEEYSGFIHLHDLIREGIV